MTQCKFFAQGLCRNGDSCKFIHEPNTSSRRHLTAVAPVSPATEKLNISPATATSRNEGATSAQNCRFFLQGKCNKGKECRYIHLSDILSPQQVHPEAVSMDPPQSPTDTRGTIPCRFLSSSRGCQNSSCPYLHATDGSNAEKSSFQDLEANDIEDQEREDDFTRNFSGATVFFNEVGHVLKVSFPTDFSLVCITGFVPETTPEELVSIIRGLGFHITADCVRISKSIMSSEPKATVKVEDPLFARELSYKLKNQMSALTAVPLPINAPQTNCRKVYASWHKSTRSVWVNFGSGDIANRVAQKFNEGKYKCLGQSVKSSPGKRSSSRWGRHGGSNPLSWTIILSDVPSDATSRDVEEAIKAPYDKPRRVEAGPMSYKASNAEVSVVVRSSLEKHGLLESFYLALTNKGKRVKVVALFEDEADARSACSLNNEPLDILGKGKLTVTLIQSAKIKVSTAVYNATKREIDMRSKTWKEQHLVLHIYPDTAQRFTTLKIEGSSTQDVASARKMLDLVLRGIVLMDGESAVWNPSLSSNGGAYRKLKTIEKELHILITRDKTERKLQYYGPPETLPQAVQQVINMLREESSTSHDIVQLHDTACTLEMRSLDIASTPEGMCPICFDDEPDTPIQTLCQHTYCLECFENCCTSAASTSIEEFRIECHGDEGRCTEVFKLTEVKDHLSSSAFEFVLKSSFTTYIKCHPNDFHSCPTPGCDYVYRSAAVDSKPPAYTCPNCLEPVCTTCHASHGDYTCAEYKDIESGGYEAMEKLKKELNIKDCPKCKTPMEKTEGCNHMACIVCKTHICWVCMAVFATSDPCYQHMTREHGGFGIGLT